MTRCRIPFPNFVPDQLTHQRSKPPKHIQSSVCILTPYSNVLTIPFLSISAIIPPESLVAISSYVTHRGKPSAILFDIPSPYTLDRLTEYNRLFSSFANTPLIPVRPSCSVDLQTLSISTRPSHTLHGRGPSITNALRTAICTKLSIPPFRLPPSHTKPPKKDSIRSISIEGPTERSSDVMDALPKLLTPRGPIYAPTPTRSLSEPPVVFFPSVVNPMESNILPLPL